MFKITVWNNHEERAATPEEIYDLISLDDLIIDYWTTPNDERAGCIFIDLTIRGEKKYSLWKESSRERYVGMF